MLLGIMGPFAVGKTTWLSTNMDALLDVSHYPLVVVLADQAYEYHYEPGDDTWVKVKNKERWTGRREQKLACPWLREMITDQEQIWVVESARFFKGLQPELLAIYKEYLGGLRFIVPWCSGETMISFLQARCAKRNKRFRDDFWTVERSFDESWYHVKMLQKHYDPAGVLSCSIEIDPQRTAWSQVEKVVTTWLTDPLCGLDGWFAE